mmetsp:Transcript_68846/g.164026  ORF Transcript_68846/g.164026 Transcript_68846/m.164026 type:complete len:187 (-) Transcript_68846:125-685(-)
MPLQSPERPDDVAAGAVLCKQRRHMVQGKAACLARVAAVLVIAQILGSVLSFGATFIQGGPRPRPRLQRSFRSAGGVMQATSVELELAVIQGKPVIVDFYATWCGPCQLLAPELAKVAQDLGDHVTILKVDTDVETEMSTDLGIEALPTLLFFKDGNLQPVAKVEGMVNSEWLQDYIRRNLLKPSE